MHLIKICKRINVKCDAPIVRTLGVWESYLNLRCDCHIIVCEKHKKNRGEVKNVKF